MVIGTAQELMTSLKPITACGVTVHLECSDTELSLSQYGMSVP